MFLFFKNLVIYMALFIGAYLLYGANSNAKQTIPHTDFSFVYAQF
jgi:hypothetical protein